MVGRGTGGGMCGMCDNNQNGRFIVLDPFIPGIRHRFLEDISGLSGQEGDKDKTSNACV